jgi:hypothetical protein
MLVACLILTLFTVGIVVPCVIDVATSPPWAIRTLSRRAWLVITILGSLPGCAAWLLVGRPRRISLRPHGHASRLTTGRVTMSPAEALRRHPAGRSMGLDLDPEPDYGLGRQRPRPVGPDDDDDFLLELERRIQETRGDC